VKRTQGLSCGSCIRLNNERMPGCKNTCFQLGKVPTSKPCTSFRPNHQLVTSNKEKKSRVQLICEGVYGLSASELQAVAAMLMAERMTRKQGFHFYQKVYVRYRGTAAANYFSNFMIGYIVYADSEYVRIVGEKSTLFLQLLTEKDGNSFYTTERFEPMRKTMAEKKNFVDPTIAQEIAKSTMTARLGAVSSFDEIVDKKIEPKKGKMHRSRADDLVSIVTRMQRGVLRVGKPEKTSQDVAIKMHW
jgi:hypothetical protein